MSVLDKFRVEIETPPTGLANLAKNPSGVKGAWGWVTPTSGVFLDAGVNSGVTNLTLRTNTSQPVTAYTEAVSTTPGLWAGGRVTIRPGGGTNGGAITGNHTIRVRVQFLAADKTILASGAQSAATDVGGVPVYAPPTQVPTGTVYQRFRIDLYKAGANPDAIGQVSFINAMLTRSASNPGTAFAYVEPVIWTDVTAKSLDVNAAVPALEPGIASCTLTDPTLDAALAPGRRVRLSGWNGTAWVPFFEGGMTSPLSTYLPQYKAAFEATNAISRLASVKKKGAVGTIYELPFILEGQGVAWNCEGPGGDQLDFTPATYPVAIVDNATLLDQVTMVRDSDNGYAWVDPLDILQVAKRSSMSTAVRATFTDTGASGSTSYRDIDIDKGNTDQIINTITVTVLRKLASGKTKEITRDPYVDQASVDLYGAREQTYTLIGQPEPTGAQVKAWAQGVLAANANPSIRAHSVTLTLRTDAERAQALALGMYDVVRVSKTGTMTDVDHRIVGITHRVERARENPLQHKWLVTYDLAPLVYVEPPTARRARAERSRRSIGGGSDAQDTEGLWQDATFSSGSGWANVSGTAGSLKVDSTVFLRGYINAGSGNIFLLPGGSRPATTKRFVAVATGGTIAQVNVTAAGIVSLASGNATGYLSLDGISFVAEQ